MTGPIPIPAVAFSRTRALARLAQASIARVTLLVAETGAGKSYLLRLFLERHPATHVRFDLRAEHATFPGFVRGLAEALAVAVPAMATAGFAPGDDAGDEEVAVGVAWLSEHLSNSALTLVVDELHHLEDPRGWALLAGAVDATAPDVRWILSGRSSDALPVARWLANGIIELPLDDEDLRVNVGEAREALLDRQDRPDDEEIRRLVAETRGWPLSLALALAGDRGAASERRELVYERVVGRVLELSDDELRGALQAAALFGQFDLSLLERLGYDGEAALARIRATGLIAPGPDGTHVFREPYRTRINDRLIEFTDYEKIAVRVAVALEAAKRDADALRILTQYAEAEAIAAALERSGTALLERGATLLIGRALERVPLPTLEGYPRALAVKAAVESLGERFDLAEAYYRLAIDGARDDGTRREILYRYARELLRRERTDVIPQLEAELARTRGDVMWEAPLNAILGSAYALAGRVNEAIAASRAALGGQEAIPDAGLRARVFHQVSFVAYRVADYDSAVDLGERAVVLAEQSNLYEVAARALSTLYSIAVDVRDDPRAAHGYLKRLDEAGRRAGSVFLRTYSAFGLYELAVFAADFTEVAQLDDELSAIDVTLDVWATEALLPAQALKASWDARFEHAYRLLEHSALRQSDAERRALRWSEVAMYAAAAGLRAAAIRAVASARRELRRVATGKLRAQRTRAYLALAHILLGHDGRARALLADLRSQQLSAGIAAFVESLEALRIRWLTGWYGDPELEPALGRLRSLRFGGLARFISALPVPASDAARLLSLTDSERLILTQLATGKTSREIGAFAGISPNTVDGHIRAICRKLGCSGRRRAVIVALRGGLISTDESGVQLPIVKHQ